MAIVLSKAYWSYSSSTNEIDLTEDIDIFTEHYIFFTWKKLQDVLSNLTSFLYSKVIRRIFQRNHPVAFMIVSMQIHVYSFIFIHFLNPGKQERVFQMKIRTKMFIVFI